MTWDYESEKPFLALSNLHRQRTRLVMEATIRGRGAQYLTKARSKIINPANQGRSQDNGNDNQATPEIFSVVCSTNEDVLTGRRWAGRSLNQVHSRATTNSIIYLLSSLDPDNTFSIDAAISCRNFDNGIHKTT
ncbi:hypothetical protein STEG23_032213 [Scotinomys teguina]